MNGLERFGLMGVDIDDGSLLAVSSTVVSGGVRVVCDGCCG